MNLNLHIVPETMNLPLLGEVPVTMVGAFLASLILIILAAIVRIFVIPKFKDEPGKLQNIIELIVDGIRNYTYNAAGEWAGRTLAPYIMSVILFIVTTGLLELIGMRPNTSDFNSPIALALITFVLIRVYGYSKNGFHRITGMFKPMAIMMPVNLMTQMAVPISLACRMFGNFLGGVIITEMLYDIWWLRYGIAGVLSIYFTLFHTAMQSYIFVTLSLTFIGEAVESKE